MFFASETAKSTRNERQAVLGVRFDYDLVVGCVRACSDKAAKKLRAIAKLNYRAE